jgi:5-oxoprolinase (ATP-hydrolysing) subunit C
MTAQRATLVVDAVGPATSVQDVGRFGGQRYGLGTAGAMDRMALAVAQAVLGNPGDSAAIEIGPFAATLTARDGDIRVALSGAIRPARIGDRVLAFNTTTLLREGETLNLGFAKGGVFSYLALEGGIQAAPMMGSLSVHQRAGLGSQDLCARVIACRHTRPRREWNACCHSELRRQARSAWCSARRTIISRPK